MYIQQLAIKQQLEIETQKERINKIAKDVIGIYRALFSIGAPLNDNTIQLNAEQLNYFHQNVGNSIAYLAYELQDEIKAL